ncbi:MAG: SDR family oxidoreductase [Lachnospiraceae bacterium]
MKCFDLTGKKALVTGGTRGLGKGMAEGLMEAGAEVVICGTNESVNKTAKEFRNKGLQCHGLIMNLMEKENIEKGFDNAIKMLDYRLDILVNAAGIQRRSSSEIFSKDDWDMVIAVNLTAPFILCQLAAKLMINQGKGKIINISSMLAFFGGQTVPAYAASKGGITQFSKTMCNDLAAKGININCIAPGYMMTDMNVAITGDNNSRFEEIKNRIPQGRWGTSEDLKGTCIFLASEASDYVNGAVIPVDGGYLVK